MKFFFPVFLLLCFVLNVGCKKSPVSPVAGKWTEVTAHAPFSGRYGLSGTVYNGVMWVIGGAAGNADNSVTFYDADIWSSGDGSHWTQAAGNAPFGGRYGSQALSFNGKLWLIGGNSGGILENDVWNSSNGVNWTQVLAPTPNGTATQFSPREDFGAAVFNNAMWVIGGWSGQNRNDVWSSTDGVNWTQVAANAPFSGRWGLTTLAYNNALWVIGGASGIADSQGPTIAFADVWTSNNGAAWNQVSNGKLSPTYYDQAVVNGNNLIFFTFGYLFNNWGPQDWSYTSSDGINWNYTKVSGYAARFYHLSLAYNNQVWVIAGCSNICTTNPCPTAVTYFNDVWVTQ